MRLAGPLRALGNPGIYLAVAVTLLLVVVAYQVRPSFNIPIGTPTDGPLLTGFHEPETVPGEGNLPYKAFRWSRGSNSGMTFADVGRQDFDVALTVNGIRPQGTEPARLIARVGSKVVLDEMPNGLQKYSFRVPREDLTGGTLRLDLETNSFKPRGDQRELGMIFVRAEVVPAPTTDRFVEPSAGPLVALTGAVALLGVVLALLGWGALGVFVGAMGLGGFSFVLLVFDRLWLTSRQWYWSWPGALFAAAVFAGLALAAGLPLMRRGEVRLSVWQGRGLGTLIMLVFAVRLAGQLHPSIFVYDLGFHANIFARVHSGDLLFTTQPAELGGFGYSTFYLPTPYLFVEPLNWLVRDPRMAIRLLTVGLGTLGALPVFYLAAFAARSGRAGLAAAAVYLTVPAAVVIFSWGITANIFGEFFALLSLAVAVGTYGRLSPARPAFWVLALLLMITFLGHPGVLALSMVAFSVTALLWFFTRGGRAGSRAAFGLAGAMVAAVLGAVAVYYRHFIPGMLTTLQTIQAERASGTGAGGRPLVVGGSVEDNSLGLFQREVHSFGEWLLWGLRGFWAEAQAYYRVWPAVGAIFGYVSLRPRTTPIKSAARTSGIRRAAAGWGLAVAVLGIVGWATNLFVRYALFALPVLSVGVGILLGGIWQRGSRARLVCILLLVFFAVEALGLWQYRINYPFK